MVDTDFVLYVGLAAAWVGGWATTVLGLLDEAAAGGTFKLCDGPSPNFKSNARVVNEVDLPRSWEPRLVVE